MNKLFDIASFLHFINFVIIGILFKNHYIYAFILGVLWELFEKYFVNIGYVKNKLLNNIFTKKYQYLWDENINNQIIDLIINMIGYYIGNKINII
jgi:hypothetical protein